LPLRRAQEPSFHFVPSGQLRTSRDAREALSRHGLDYFRVFVAPPSGPSVFATMGFDQQLRWLAREGGITGEKWLVGGSAGAMRFLSLITAIVSGEDCSERFVRQFTAMNYRFGDSPAALAPLMESLFEALTPPRLIDEVLAHERFRLAIMVAALKPRWASLPPSLMHGALLGFGAANVVSPSTLRHLFSRICFYSGSRKPDFFEPDAETRFVPLTRSNIRQVLAATTCIPIVSERCEEIEGVGRGLFFDGSLSDCHLNFAMRSPGLLLLDECSGRAKRTAFDLCLPFRGVPTEYFEHCSVLHPSRAYVEALPEKRVPHLSDWFRPELIADPERRQQHWLAAYRLSCQRTGIDLADAFTQAARPVPSAWRAHVEALADAARLARSSIFVARGVLATARPARIRLS
jgi:hypothetical protein